MRGLFLVLFRAGFGRDESLLILLCAVILRQLAAALVGVVVPSTDGLQQVFAHTSRSNIYYQASTARP